MTTARPDSHLPASFGRPFGWRNVAQHEGSARESSTQRLPYLLYMWNHGLLVWDQLSDFHQAFLNDVISESRSSSSNCRVYLPRSSYKKSRSRLRCEPLVRHLLQSARVQLKLSLPSSNFALINLTGLLGVSHPQDALREKGHIYYAPHVQCQGYACAILAHLYQTGKIAYGPGDMIPKGRMAYLGPPPRLVEARMWTYPLSAHLEVESS